MVVVVGSGAPGPSVGGDRRRTGDDTDTRGGVELWYKTTKSDGNRKAATDTETDTPDPTSLLETFPHLGEGPNDSVSPSQRSERVLFVQNVPLGETTR